MPKRTVSLFHVCSQADMLSPTADSGGFTLSAVWNATKVSHLPKYSGIINVVLQCLHTRTYTATTETLP